MINTDCAIVKVKNLPRAQVRATVDYHLRYKVKNQVSTEVAYQVLNQVWWKVFK